MKKYIIWLIYCFIVFVISIFLHECGHGLANAISGISCSTGFNRVGDIYKYPSDSDFRAVYNQAEAVLIDFGVPCTLVLAAIGTVMFYRSRNINIRYLGAAISSTNSLLRLIPCLGVVLLPLLTGKTHVEDEYEIGVLLTQITGDQFWLYVPALISIAVSVICIILLTGKARKIGILHLERYALFVFIAFYLGMIVANSLDNIIRLNWVAF